MKTKTFNILFGFILERCVFLTGDGEGSSEKKLGTTETSELCFEKVAKQEPKANGVTYGRHGQGRDKECYAEFKMTQINKNANKWQSCLFGGNSYLRNIPQFQNRLRMALSKNIFPVYAVFLLRYRTLWTRTLRVRILCWLGWQRS